MKRSHPEEHIFDVFEHLIRHPNTTQNMALNYARKYYTRIVDNAKFCSLSINVLLSIFKEDIDVENQETISESIFKWLQSNPVDPNVGLNLILSGVKLSLLSFRYIEYRILPYASKVPDYSFKIIMSQQVYLSKLMMTKTANLERVEAPEGDSNSSATFTDTLATHMSIGVSHIEKLFKKPICKIAFLCKGVTRTPFFHVLNCDEKLMEIFALPPIEIECYKTAFFDNRLMVIGGIRQQQITKNVYLINIKNGSILLIDSLNHHRSNMGVAQINKKSMIEVYAIGGWRIINDMQNTYKEVERWDSIRQKWVLIASMHQNRASIKPAVLKGKIYVAGGYGSDGTSMECYDPNTDTWTMLAPMKQRRRYCTLVAYGDKIFALGGSSYLDMSLLRSTESYDPESNTWSSFTDLVQPSRVHAFSARNKLFYSSIDSNIANLMEYDVQDSEWKNSAVVRSPHNCIFMDAYLLYE